MMGGMGFRGTSADQDYRFKSRSKVLLAKIAAKAPKEYAIKVDMSKVKRDVIENWVDQKITQLLGVEDEVLVSMITNLLDEKPLDPKRVQLEVEGFLHKKAGPFTRELWSMLVSAQSNPHGIPQSLLDAKKAELAATSGGAAVAARSAGEARDEFISDKLTAKAALALQAKHQAEAVAARLATEG